MHNVDDVDFLNYIYIFTMSRKKNLNNNINGDRFTFMEKEERKSTDIRMMKLIS